MAFDWGEFQPYLTAEQATAPMSRQMSGSRVPTTGNTNGIVGERVGLNVPSNGIVGTALGGNTLGFSPQQEAAVRQWSATGGSQVGSSGYPGNPGDPLAFIAQWQASKPATPESFQQLAQELQTRFGIQRAPGAVGPSNNEFMINGEKVKVMAGEDSGSPSWFAYGADDGWRPGGDSAMGAGYSLQGGPLSSFSAPGLVAPWTREFQRPDPEQIANDPSYKFQLAQGLQGVQRSASAKGTLYTGGTLKDLNDYAQGLASTFDDKYYNRAFNEYGMDRDSFWGNQNNAYNKLSGYAGMGQDAATASGNFGSQYADNAQQGATNLGNLYTDQGNANAAAGIAGQNATSAAASGVANAIGGLDWEAAREGGGFDWSSLFKRKPSIAALNT